MSHFQNLVAIDAEKIFARVNELEKLLKEESRKKTEEWFLRERNKTVRKGIWPWRKDYLRTTEEIDRLYKSDDGSFYGSPYYWCEKKYENEIEWLYKIWRMAKNSASPRQVLLTQTDYERIFYG